MEHAFASAKLLMSAPHATKARIKKEGREFSVYIYYKRPKIKKWGYGKF